MKIKIIKIYFYIILYENKVKYYRCFIFNNNIIGLCRCLDKYFVEVEIFYV